MPQAGNVKRVLVAQKAMRNLRVALPKRCMARNEGFLLGHDTLLTTEIYLNLSPEHVVEEFQQKW